MLLLNYLARKGCESKMIAGLTLSVSWNSFESSKSLEQPVNKLLFNRHLTKNLCHAINRLLIHSLNDKSEKGLWMWNKVESRIILLIYCTYWSRILPSALLLVTSTKLLPLLFWVCCILPLKAFSGFFQSALLKWGEIKRVTFKQNFK